MPDEEVMSAPEPEQNEPAEDSGDSEAQDQSSNYEPRQSEAPEPEVEADAEDQEQDQEKLKPEPKPEPRRYKVKVQGQEREVTEEELIQAYSASTAANEKFQEAAKMRKQATQFLQNLTEDPFQVLTDPRLGIKPEDLRAKFESWYHENFVEPELLSPEERKFRQQEKELQQYREQEKKREAEEKEQRIQALQQQYSQRYQKLIQDAVQQSGLPASEEVIMRIASYMKKAREAKMDPAEVMPLIVQNVKKDFETSVRNLYGSMNGEQLLAILGEDTAKKIREAEIQKLRGGVPAQAKPKRAKPEAKKMTVHEFRESLFKD